MKQRPLWQWALWPVGVLTLVNLALLLSYTIPKQNRERYLVDRVAKLRAAVTTRRVAAANAREAVARVEGNTRDEERLISKLLPSEDEGLLTAIQEIESLVRSPGLTSAAHGFSHESLGKSGIRRMSVTVPLEGGYRTLVTFLSRVEESKTFLTVDSITLHRKSAKGGDGDSGVLQIGLSAWFRDGEKRS